MSVLLRVNGRDLSAYVNIQPDDGLEPTSEGEEPIFAGSPAFREGEEFVTDEVGNRAWVVPLILDAPSRAQLHQLVTDINNDLDAGAQVAFAVDSADPVSYFTLERGRLDANFNQFLAQHSTGRFTLNLWTRPYASTGTMRTVASFTSTGPLVFPATGVLGDRSALANLEVRVGSQVASSGRVVGYGVFSSASANPLHTAAAGASQIAPQASTTVIGASGAVASRYLAVPVSPTGASGIAFTDYITPAAAHVGRHRVFALARSGLTQPITMVARDRFGAVLGPTAQATQTDLRKWQLLDLGEVHVPARASGQEAVPTQYVEVVAGGASGAAINASPGLHLNALLYLPLENTPGLLRTPGADGGNLLYGDGFGRITDQTYLEDSPQAESGNTSWSRVAGRLGGLNSFFGITFSGKVGPALATANAYPGAYPNASAIFSLASGANLSDAQMSAAVGLNYGASPAAASAAVVLYPQFSAGAGIFTGYGAKLQLGPSQTLQIVQNVGVASSNYIASITTETVLASAGIASTLASGLYLGQPHTLLVRKSGPRIDVWLATAPQGSPILSASNAGFVAQGNPAVRMNAGSNVASAVITLDDVRVESIGGSAPDAAAQEWFRFESHPQRRAVQSNASVFKQDLAFEFLGEHPRLPAVGSPGPSGPAQVIVFQGEVDNFLGNDAISVGLFAQERWSFLR